MPVTLVDSAEQLESGVYGLYDKYFLFQYSRANIVKLSTFIGAFEDYLENNAAKDLSVLPQDIQLLLESPLSLNYIVTMGCASPYDVESDEFDLLLQWLEYSAGHFYLLKRNDPEMFEQFSEIVSAILIALLEDDKINPDCAYQVVRVLKSHQVSVPEEVMSWLQKIYIDNDNHTGTYVIDSPDGLISHIHASGIRNGEDFVVLMMSELAMLPEGGVAQLLSIVSELHWYLDAAVILLAHQDENVRVEVQDFLQQLPDREWSKLSNIKYLSLLRYHAGVSLKVDLERWQRLTLRAQKHDENDTEVLEVQASMPDGQDAVVLMLLLKRDNEYSIWSGMLRLDLGIVDGMYRPDVDMEEWRQLKSMAAEDVDAMAVSLDYPAKVFPWLLAVGQKASTWIDIETLLLLARVPLSWGQPQPIRLLDVIKEFETDPSEREINLARSCSAMILDHPIIQTWLEIDLPAGCKTVRDVINKVYLADRSYLAKRLVLSGLLCRYQLKSELRADDEKLFMLCAYDLLVNDLKRKKLPLLEQLAERSLSARGEQAVFLATNKLAMQPGHGYVLKVELNDVSPAVWRRFTVSNKCSLLDLHTAVQVVMGWDDAHLFEFQKGKTRYSPDFEGNVDGAIDNDDEGFDGLAAIPLGSLLKKPNDSIYYIYDFGNNWHHTITLERINKRDCLTPVVTAGKNRCPPEECGGVPGYQELLEAYKSKEAGALEQLEWFGWDEDGFDPKAFDKKTVNQQLQHVFSD